MVVVGGTDKWVRVVCKVWLLLDVVALVRAATLPEPEQEAGKDDNHKDECTDHTTNDSTNVAVVVRSVMCARAR